MTNTSDAIADATTYSKTHLTGHIGVFRSNTNIADAMGYSSLPGNVRSKIWTAFDAADALGLPVADLGQPTGYDHDPFNLIDSTKTIVNLTLAETEDSYASRVAHVFWVELFQDFPWSVLKYDLESCQALLSVDEAFMYVWNGWGGSPPAAFTTLVEFSPRRAWNKASAIIGAPSSPDSVVGDIFEQHRLWASPYGLAHGATVFPPIDVTDTYNASNVADAGPGFGNQYMGHEGCWFAVALMRALVCAINIPALRIEYKWEGRFHASMLLPTLSPVVQHPDMGDDPQQGDTGIVMPHGDNLYFLDGWHQMVGTQMGVNRRYWDANITGTDDPRELFKWSRRIALFDFWQWSDTLERKGILGFYHSTAAGWRYAKAYFASGLDLDTESTILDNLHDWCTERNGGVDKDAFGTIYVGDSGIESDDFTNVFGPGSSISWMFNMFYYGHGTEEGGTAILTCPADVDCRMGNFQYLANTALQFCDDGDFEVEVKWTTLPANGTEAGIIAWESDTYWIAATLYDNAGTLYLKGGLLYGLEIAWAFDLDVSGTITGSVGYVKMGRVKATNTWSVEYSANGTNWVEPAGSPFVDARTISRIGFYAANAGADPVFRNVAADYFFENLSGRPPSEDP